MGHALVVEMQPNGNFCRDYNASLYIRLISLCTACDVRDLENAACNNGQHGQHVKNQYWACMLLNGMLVC